MSFIADPRLEDGGSENAAKPRKTVVEIMDDVTGKGGVGGSWKGVVGRDKIPSDGEWQTFLRGENPDMPRSFLYYGPGRCMARFSPSKLSGLNIDNCSLVILADRAENDASYRRQSKLDNQKRGEQLNLEQSLETAALYSLAGANCVVLHRWAGSFQMLGEFVKNFTSSLSSGKSVSAALVEFKGKQKDGRGLKERVKLNVISLGLPMLSLDSK